MAHVSSDPVAQPAGTYVPRNASAWARVYGHGVVSQRSKIGSWQYLVTASASLGSGRSRRRRGVLMTTGRIVIES
jgi:hypothetical protein